MSFGPVGGGVVAAVVFLILGVLAAYSLVQVFKGLKDGAVRGRLFSVVRKTESPLMFWTTLGHHMLFVLFVVFGLGSIAASILLHI